MSGLVLDTVLLGGATPFLSFAAYSSESGESVKHP